MIKVIPVLSRQRTGQRNPYRAIYLLRCQIMAMRERDLDRDLMMECCEVAMSELRAENTRLRELLALYADIDGTCEALGCEIVHE